MANERVQTILACNRDVPCEPPSSKQDCSDVVNVSVFFDGTGNNKDIDAKNKNWSNPARLWFSAFNYPNPNQNNYPIYISGVGTKFNGNAANWWDEWRIKGEDTVGGDAFGAGGSRRLSFGQDNVNKALRQALFDSTKKLNATAEVYSEQSKNRSMKELGKALTAHRLIKVINLSIFGFSRGAALARAFSNDFIRSCKKDAAGNLIYLDNNRSIPIRIHFMGLFDTVASFGVPAANLDWPWTEKDLTIPPQVERCVHYVAAHELRFSFPVDLICQHGKLMPNWAEEVYPGSHSDVGGGYWPLTEVNKSNPGADHQGLSNNYARIPMRDMMREAVINGVRILSYRDLEQAPKTKALFGELYAVDPKTEGAFNKYIDAVPATGTVEQKINAHMTALYSAYGTMSRKGIKTPDLISAEGKKLHAFVGHVSMAREAEALLNPDKGAALMREQASKTLEISAISPIVAVPQAMQFLGTAYGQVVKPEEWRLKAWNSPADNSILTFIQHYIHDSKAGFIMSVEPFSYFRSRGISESSRNILAKGLQWLDENIEAIKNNVIKIYYQAEGVVVETWQQGVLTATQTYQVGEKFVIDTVQSGEKYATEVYQTSKKVVITAVGQGQKMMVTSIDTLQKKASSLADSMQKNAAKLEQQMDQSYQRVSDVVSETMNAGMEAVEEAWNSTKVRLGL
jgi:hypothetical protein